MNPASENELRPTVLTDSSRLERELQDLRGIMTAALLCLVLFMGGINLFLFRDARTSSRDLQAITPAVEEAVRLYEEHDLPMISHFLTSLVQFSRTNGDVQPILDRHLGKGFTLSTNAVQR
jgi:hypothetical protein